MTNAFVKKIILFISTLFLSSLLCAANLQYFVNQPTNQSLTAPYATYSYQPSPMMDKAIENLPTYSNVKKCTTNNITDAIIILNPILSYQAQSTILYGDLHVKIYQKRSNNETNPDNFIKKMKISLWKVVQFDKVTMGYYVNEIYTDLLKKLISEIDDFKIDKNHPTNGSYCDLLNTLQESRLNLNY
ncbi:hypothetical protein OAO24_04050 [Methylophilaceae bacterium]|nr:hypothetical protein [Methylophilaceae bacterium]|tara:strand:- start:40 stop:600 length:561 start_codon:yes stop_codon:yes gene_type:complete